MKKILLFLLFFTIPLFAQTFDHIIVCDDDAATTVVSNDGSAADWVGGHNTDVYASAVGTNSFHLSGTGHQIHSAANWTGQALTIQWDERFLNATAAANEVHVYLGDGDDTPEANEIFLYRASSSTEWKIYINTKVKTTTDHSPNNTSFYTYVLSIVDTSVILTQDGVALTWGAWDSPPAIPTYNAPFYFGTTSALEPDAYFKNIKIWADDTTTYYIDGDKGSDDFSGFSPTTPWKTIAKVNAASLDPGDIVYLRTDDTWRELLTVPTSGSAGLPITFTKYDSTGESGADPIISGADLLKGGSLVNVSGDKWYILGYSTAPLIAVFRDTLGVKAATSAAVDAEKEWFWTTAGDDTLFIYSTDTTDIEYGQRSILIDIVGKNYITVDGIAGKISNSNGFRATDADFITFNAVDVSYCWDNNLIFYDTGGAAYDSNMTITNSTFSYAGENGIGTGQYYKNVLIQGNTLHHNGQDGSDAYNGALYMWDDAHGTSYGFIVENNIAHNNGRNYAGVRVASSTGGYGLWTDTQGSNAGADPIIIRYNITYNNTHTGVFLENTPDAQAYYNISYDDSSGIRVATSDADYHADDNLVYNNTVYNASSYAIHVGDDSTEGTIVKNNIVHTAGTGIFYHENANTTTMDYNLYYDATLTNKFNWNGSTSSTLAAWQSASSQEANSLPIADPLFTNAASNDFTLTASSPCINAGVSVGLVLDYAGNTVPFETLPDIGAYEYQLSTSAGYEARFKLFKDFPKDKRH